MTNPLIIDVREPFEFAFGYAPGAVNITPAEMMSGSKKLADVPKDTEIILYCRTGGRAGRCVDVLKQMGFTNVVNGINKDHVRARLAQS